MSAPTFQLSGGSKCVIKKLSATQNQIWQEDFLSNSLIYTEYKNAIGNVFNGFLLRLRKFRFSKVIWWWNNRCVCQGLSKLANSWPFYLYFWNFVFAKMFLYLCISSCDTVFLYLPHSIEYCWSLVFFQSVFLGRLVCSSGELSQLATDRPFYGRDQHQPHLLFYLITKLYEEYPCICSSQPSMV